VTLDGADVPRSLWPHVRPKPGRTLTVRAVPMGGDTNKSSIFTGVFLDLFPLMGLSTTATSPRGVTHTPKLMARDELDETTRTSRALLKFHARPPLPRWAVFLS
jgi:hypothetical protein